ncbi:MAG: sensor histidine kinase [Anaerolineae bacterium]|jgi:two-component system sensor histidine kinase DegS|nr:sensor histidine kinase [Anaerolineae bacterium]MDH7472691.1 histidine kinase [Anaerolineae bacterium]
MTTEQTASAPSLSPLQQHIQECHKEYEQTQKELKEIDLLIQQSSDEVDKLARRNAQITNRLRQIEANFDTVPRSDIQEVYTAAQEAQKRLFMMKGQLEKLQSDQQHLQKLADLLRRFLEIADQEMLAIQPAETTSTPKSVSQQMIVRIIEAQENERQHLARQMHDGPAQSLTNLILQAEICERLFDMDKERARAELAALKAAVNSTFQKTRNFIFELRPMILDDLGLVPTLKRYVESFTENSGIPTNLSIAGKERRMPPHTEVTVFRVIQELLNNARQHAQPTRIQVNLDIEPKLVRAIVEDDGIGFDVAGAMASARQQKTLGIATLQERVEMLGGQLAFESSVGRGTKVTLEIPIE